MPRIAYVEARNFKPDTLAIIALADEICTDYEQRGFNLTLRQLYYQFIARDAFPNSEKSYDKLGRIVNDARLAGLIDWHHLEDRGRESHGTGWLGTIPEEQAELIRNAQFGYTLDLWEGQPRRVEVWVEKQALEEVAGRPPALAARVAGRARLPSPSLSAGCVMGRHVADSPVDTDRLSPWVRSHLEAPSHAAGPHRDPFENRRAYAAELMPEARATREAAAA